MLAGNGLLAADPIQAKHKQGSNHAFILLKDQTGRLIALGDHISITEGNQVNSRLTFHFKDGSLDDETTVYRQTSVLQLVTDHHVQHGPSFPQPVDLTINMPENELKWREAKAGKEDVKVEHKSLPADLVNGLLGPMLQNYPKGSAELKASYVSGDSKLRIVQLSVKPAGKGDFTVAGTSHLADQYTIHVELGGIAGAVAPMLGKQPADTDVWLLAGPAPTFIRLVGALYPTGPIWTAELTSLTWSGEHETASAEIRKGRRH
ncbi:MAG: hypothetical protein INR62_01705 [Rhodospirillales bacterium]|nr:hypothetical protein [Acetobacter sp.]